MVIKMCYDFSQFPISMEFAQSHKVHILHTLLYGSNMKTYTMHFNFLNISVYILEILLWDNKTLEKNTSYQQSSVICGVILKTLYKSSLFSVGQITLHVLRRKQLC